MVNIKDIKDFSELNLRQTFRAHILYEQIMGHGFTGSDGLNGVIVLFFSYIAGSNPHSNVDYDEYMDWLDENPNMLTLFSEWIQAQNTAKHSMTQEKEENPGE